MNAKRYFIIMLIIGIFLKFSSMTLAQDNVDKLSLQQSIDLALERNLGLKAQAKGILSSIEKVKYTKSDFFPQLGIEASYTRLSEAPSADFMGSTVAFGDNDSHSGSLVLEQPVFTGGALTNNLELEKKGQEVEETGLEILKEDLKVQVTKAYFGVLSIAKLKNVAVQSVELLETHLKEAHDFYETGMVPKSDVLRAEVELANTKQNLIKVENSLDLAKAAFNTLLNLPLEKEFVLEDILEQKDINIDLQKGLQTALIHRAEIKQMKQNIEQADLGISLAKSSRYPQVYLVGDYSIDNEGSLFGGQEQGEWSVTAVASWNIFDWGKIKHQVGEVVNQKAQAEYFLQQLEEGIRLEVKRAVSNFQEAEKNIKVVEKSIEQAEENLRIANERYKANVTTSTEVLDAETLLTRAKVNYFTALYDYNIAIADIEKAIGMTVK